MGENNTAKNKDEEKGITPRNVDYSEWYQDVIYAAGLAEHSPVKGCMIIKPNGYAIWELTQKILDEKFKETGVENAYFPLLIPEKLLKREEAHVEGFAPEVAVVTHAGGKELDEPLIVRPTSETIMYEVFSNWIRSYRDLPLLINQWANVVRWEMRTRLFLRTTEFLWQEGHTVHATNNEADKRAKEMLEIYRNFAEEYMAIAVIPGIKSESEKFAGALHTYTIEAMMQDGKALQFATSHNLGDNFAKVFNVQYLDENNKMQFGHQTSWGLSTRTIGGLIMAHSDDKGLVLPPQIAPIKIVIIPIFQSDAEKDNIFRMASILKESLESVESINKNRVKIDLRENIRPGEKFYEWEKRGIPIRIELGPKDINNNQCVVVQRFNGVKEVVSINNKEDFVTRIEGILNSIQESLLNRSRQNLKEKTIKVDSWEDFVKKIEEGNFVLAHWDGTTETEKLIKDETGATIRCIPFEAINENGNCVKTGNMSKQRVIFAKAY